MSGAGAPVLRVVTNAIPISPTIQSKVKDDASIIRIVPG